MESMFEGEEALPFEIIASAGQARSLAFEALAKAKEGDFDAADRLMKESESAFLAAHDHQTKLLVQEANGNHVAVDVMLVHAQDHLMTSMLAQELIKEIICLYKKDAK